MKNWVKQRYNFLIKKFDTKELRFDEISESLKEKYKDKEEKILVILSELKKESLLDAEMDKIDSRKKIYKLIDVQKEIKGKEILDRKDLETLLKDAADIIRNKVDYSFILLLLFYKKVSDKWHKDYDVALKESIDLYSLSEEEAKKNAENPTYHDFIIPEDYLWENIRKKPEKLAENFSMAMKVLAEKNPGYKDVFENFDFVQFVGNTENQEILYQLVEIFSVGSLENASPDVLGDAYEWLIRLFAPQKAKEGEVYTSREIIKLLVSILDPKPGESVYDPALGSAGMLIGAHTFVKEKHGDDEAKQLFLYGQEANYKTRSIAKMNLYLHGIKNGIPEYGDTLLYPKFKEESKLQQFDIVLANPPWNMNGYSEETLKRGEFWKERYNEYGFAPDQSADWIWISHMWASSKPESGRIGIVIDSGALFRGGKERIIREKFVRDNNIECIILLPEKLFYNTPAAGTIIILNKNKRDELKDKILFINATNEFIKHPEVRRLNSLSEENIKNIVRVYKDTNSRDGFARVITLEDIKDNDFNLNVTQYVFSEDENILIDIPKEWENLMNTNIELKNIEEKIKNFLIELNY